MEEGTDEMIEVVKLSKYHCYYTRTPTSGLYTHISMI